MNDHRLPCGTTLTENAADVKVPSWSDRFGEKHRLHRVINFPSGIIPPHKIRLYFRNRHYVLQWWDPKARANLCDRVDGDLVAAITRARQIEERLANFKSSGQVGHRRLGHAELVSQFLADLTRRSDADEIDPATVKRYEAALRHYLVFCDQQGIAKTYPHASRVNREFRLGLTAFLATRSVSSNGNPCGHHRPMRSQSFILDTVRALFEWAADPERGGLLPEGFQNPFRRSREVRSILQGDPIAEPDITLSMAIELICACDAFQLRLFVPMLLFGLRAAEPCFLFHEHIDDHWLRVWNIPDLAYRTKGRRDKKFPLIDDLKAFWNWWRQGTSHGLLYQRRGIVEARERTNLQLPSMADLIEEFRQRCASDSLPGAARRKRVRDELLCEAGGLSYDHIQAEFAGLARQLSWPREASLKDLRHLFATTMNNAAMPETYRRYFMGHSLGRSAISAYTHLHDLQRHYAEAVRREWIPLFEAIQSRIHAIQEILQGC